MILDLCSTRQSVNAWTPMTQYTPPLSSDARVYICSRGKVLNRSVLKSHTVAGAVRD